MSSNSEMSSRIETLERGYEYLLAYAAQGRLTEEGSEARPRLQEMFEALDDFGDLVADVVKAASSGSAGAASDAPGAGGAGAVASFVEAVRQDAAKARGAIGLVLSRPAISSMLVDNLNASIHLRALLTDCFLVEQAFKS
jgi:hypothetical protein